MPDKEREIQSDIAVPPGGKRKVVPVDNSVYFPHTKSNIILRNPPLIKAVMQDRFFVAAYGQMVGTNLRVSDVGALAFVENSVPREDKTECYFDLLIIQRVRLTNIFTSELEGNLVLECDWQEIRDPEIPENKWNSQKLQKSILQTKTALNKFLREVTGFMDDYLDLSEDIRIISEDDRETVAAKREEISELLQDFTSVRRDNLGVMLDKVSGFIPDLFVNFLGQELTPEILSDLNKVLSAVDIEKRLKRFGAVIPKCEHYFKHLLETGGEASGGGFSTGGGGKNKASQLNPLLERYEIIKNRIPEEARKEIELLLKRLESSSRENEAAVEKLEWLVFLPWIEETADPDNITEVRRLLDREHAVLQKAKERIEEFLAGRMLNPEGEGSILCFVGPPGTGKTSFANAIARALGRKCVSLKLGDFEDSKELVGFHQTYYRAAPGALIMLFRRCGTRNPVIVFDEVDKLNKWKGNPAAVLLEIFDPEQNDQFRDHYLNVPFDISRALIITTANILDTIPAALRDRMEIIEFAGYTPSEKLEIAKEHLVPKRRQKRGFPVRSGDGREALDITFTDDALSELIHRYTREAGVRNLEREIDKPFRRTARLLKSGNTAIQGVIKINTETLREFCGKPPIEDVALPDILPPGTVPVLAVSETGGELFMFEVTINPHPGKRKIATKGVRESHESKDSSNKIAESVEKQFDALTTRGKLLHSLLKQIEKEEFGAPIILGGNITNGAIPKDGPSAGLSIFLAIYGVLTNQSIKPTREAPLLAATGQTEVNLDIVGKIGGLRDKLFAAERQGVKLCFVPQANSADIDDIPDEIKSKMRIVPIANRWEALMIAYPKDKEKILEYLRNQNRSS